MVYAILPALIPDIEKVYDVYFAAFKGDKMGRIMVDLLFPAGSDSDEFRKAHTAGTLAWWHTCGVQYTYKCVDTETGEIIGMALGDILLQGRTDEERKYQSVGWLEGEQRERADAVLKPLHEAREKLFGGRPHICKHNPDDEETPQYGSRPNIFSPADVHVIGIHPNFQGRQAGALWCKWGMDLSDSLGLPLYFEASPSTYKLYEKIGYETLEEKIVHSPETMGTDTPIEVPLMVNMPRAAGGLTFRDWRAAGYPAFGKTPPAGDKVVSAVKPKSSGTRDIIVTEVQEVKV